jgi:predicted short-subunit dehydrogenase-like oxidoreductase (DUF2520 family)
MAGKIENITIIGSGNVAWHLSRALYNEGFQIVEFVGRDTEKTSAYAARVFAMPVLGLENMSKESDLYIIAISDDALPEIVAKMPEVEGIVVHTSGSAPLNILSRFNHYGVFYPLQTFSEGRTVEFEEIPVLIEANTPAAEDAIMDVARELTLKTYRISTEEREKLHVAAVFVCNFVNHMFTIGHQICASHQLPFDILHPLMLETVRKATSASPASVQTGPAIRNDQKTIAKHLSQLEDDQKEIYQLLTRHIQQTHR